jgi:PRC-barrel domain
MPNLILAVSMTMALLAPAAAQTSPSGPVPASPGAVTSSTTAIATLKGATRILTVDALEAMDLVGADGKGIGAVDGVVENNADNKQFALVRRGGLLGLGAREIAIPLENLAIESGRVTLRNMDVAQFDEIPEFKAAGNSYRRLDKTQEISLPQQR